jgi:hypoxanthine phosphoribosyltransferase
MSSLGEIASVTSSAEIIYSREEVENSITEMAEKISGTLSQSNPLVLCVMIGGIVATAKLIEKLTFPFELDYIHASRYRGETSGGDIHWIATPKISLSGRTVLIIDDILDEGHTLQEIIKYCMENGAKQVLSAVLVEKNRLRKTDITADFTGLQVPDRYVFGYGMDYKNYLRNLPGIYAVSEQK